MDWFLYDRDFRDGKINYSQHLLILKNFKEFVWVNIANFANCGVKPCFDMLKTIEYFLQENQWREMG